VITINGIGGKLHITKVGKFMGVFQVYYHPDCTVNILSCGTLSKLGYHVKYDHNEQSFTVADRDTNTDIIVFGPCGNVYGVDLSNDQHLALNYSSSVENNKRKYTKREVIEAELARNVSKRLGFPSDEQLSKMTSVINIPVGRKQIRRAQDIFGPDINVIRGKTRRKVVPTETIDRFMVDVSQPQIAYSDLFFIDGDSYLITVFRPCDYTVVNHIKDRSAECIKVTMFHQLRILEAQKFTIDVIVTDNEGGILAIGDELLRNNYLLNSVGAGEHVSIVENKIKTLKGRCRSYLNSLYFPLMFSALRYLVEYVTIMLNLVPSKIHEDPTSPYEKVYGIKIDFKVQLRISFGDYAECTIIRSNSNSV
jgi:hypothetical protein